MAEVKNQNTIAIFKNADKKSEKSPDYSGSLEINGVKYRTALWLKQSKSGTAFLGGLVELAEEKQAPTAAKPAYQPVVNDDLGF
jgi:hypothetical protein